MSSDAILSVQCQSHAVDQIIVVDDGSTDDTRAVVKTIDPNIIYIRQDNQGPSAARNRGIETASGEWIAFLDADDQWLPNKIEKQLALLTEYPELHLIAADMKEIDSKGRELVESVLAKHGLLNKFKNLKGAPVPDALAALVYKNYIPTGTVLVRRATLRKVGLFKPAIRFGEDLELWAKIANEYPISCMPEVFMLRRQHGHNATQRTESMLSDLIKVMLSIESWGKQTLIKQNVNTHRLVANAFADLGYWHFANGNFDKARSIFFRSLRRFPSKRALIYGLASLLPPLLIHRVRKFKQQFF